MKAPAPALDFARWIVWEDEGLLAVDKPAGVLSQGGEGGAGVNVVDLARAHLGRGDVGVLHRIDRNVSGVVLVAKEPRMARLVTMLVQRGGIERVYRAVVRGVSLEQEFTMDAWLAKNPATNEVRAVPADRGRSPYREARTDARLLAQLGPVASLEIRPITGRSHQIRVHLAFAGLPIVGDPKYGVPARGLNRPLLHAERVAFVHPRTRARVVIEAPVPWDDGWLRALKLV